MTTRHSLFGTLSGLALFLAMSSVQVSAQSDPKASASSKASARTAPPALIQVSGEVSHPLALSAADLAKLKHQTVRAKRHDGVESQFEGVPLVDILAQAGVPVGNNLRGPAMALYLVVEASDGYRAVFALAELDPAFTDRVVLLADRRDGQPLSARDGPLQIVVPGEKKHARWVRQVIKLKVGRG
jgi:DMSO/TMAO reductase YedYZ molybdopterin-dependent catalytic subunit